MDCDDSKVRAMITDIAKINREQQGDSLKLKFGDKEASGEELIKSFMIYFTQREINELSAQLGNIEQLESKLRHLTAQLKIYQQE